MIESLPPGMILVLGALVVPLLRGRLAQLWMLLLPVAGAVQIWLLPADYSWTYEVFGYQLELVRVDKLARLFGTIFHIAALLSVLYAIHVKDRVQQVSGLMYPGAAIGAVFAGDLITLFVFWEATAITSVFLIWARRTERAYKTGMRYLIIQVLSGVLLAVGALVHYSQTGSLAFDDSLAFEHLSDLTLGSALIFLAFGIKAAFPLLHNWLQDSYPEATVTGTVFLSAFTTKLAIYALARGYPGTEILIPIGALMTAFPIFFAVIENDLRRVLAYSLNNQLGYMVVGVGIGTELALNGTVSHAFAHILYKGLLFMSMGAVLFRAGTINGSDLGGLYKSMPWTTVLCSIGAASISAFPLFSGFVTKSMIMTAAAEEHHTLAFLVLLFAGAGVFHHSGIKIPYFAFFAHDSGIRTKEAPWNMLVAMGIAAALCIGIGVWPEPLYQLLPWEMEHAYVPYDVTHVVTQSQLLFFSALAFIFLQKTGLYPPELRAVHIDTDVVYRRWLPDGIGWAWKVGGRIRENLALRWERSFGAVMRTSRRLNSPGVGLFGEPWPIGTTALWAAVLLAVCLVLYLF